MSQVSELLQMDAIQFFLNFFEVLKFFRSFKVFQIFSNYSKFRSTLKAPAALDTYQFSNYLLPSSDQNDERIRGQTLDIISSRSSCKQAEKYFWSQEYETWIEISTNLDMNLTKVLKNIHLKSFWKWYISGNGENVLVVDLSLNPIHKQGDVLKNARKFSIPKMEKWGHQNVH